MPRGIGLAASVVLVVAASAAAGAAIGARWARGQAAVKASSATCEPAEGEGETDRAAWEVRGLRARVQLQESLLETALARPPEPSGANEDTPAAATPRDEAVAGDAPLEPDWASDAQARLQDAAHDVTGTGSWGDVVCTRAECRLELPDEGELPVEERVRRVLAAVTPQLPHSSVLPVPDLGRTIILFARRPPPVY